MLITFKSPAGADVLMFGKNGQQMLAIIGKDVNDPRGIVTFDQLPAALEQLEAARLADLASRHTTGGAQEDGEEARGMAAPVSIAQRIVPLQELLRYALQEKAVVTWEAT